MPLEFHGSRPNDFICLVGCFCSLDWTSNQLIYSWSLSFDSDGNMFVTDRDNHRIEKFVLSTTSCAKYHEKYLIWTKSKKKENEIFLNIYLKKLFTSLMTKLKDKTVTFNNFYMNIQYSQFVFLFSWIKKSNKNSFSSLKNQIFFFFFLSTQ